MPKPSLHLKSSLRLLAFTLFAGLFGHSIAVVAKLEPVPLVIGAVAIAVVAFFISRALLPLVRVTAETLSPLAARGLRLATIGLLLAATGWLATVYITPLLGVVLVCIGILLGFIGIAIGQFATVTKR